MELHTLIVVLLSQAVTVYLLWKIDKILTPGKSDPYYTSKTPDIVRGIYKRP